MKHKGKVSREQMIRSAKLAAWLGGCDCEPKVTLREVAPGVFTSMVEHTIRCGHPTQQKGGDA
jgi:hypothetical protein